MMRLNNTPTAYGLVSIVLHWVSAIAVFALFVLGIWMLSLSYYDPLYQRLPHFHKSFGVLLIMLTVCRLVWRFVQVRPSALSTHSPLQRRVGHLVHLILYSLLLLMLPSGYLISTADGRSLEVFKLFSIPALFDSIEQLEDIAGTIHKWLAYTLIGLAVIHALAAIKHHFIDRDVTLKRMIKPMKDD